MGVFVQPPFWASGARAHVPHAVSVLVVPPTIEPLTLDQAKARAGLTWPADDPRDDLMRGFIAAARSKVEQRTGLALLTQTRDVYYDALPVNGVGTFRLPAQSLPLQEVVSITATDSSGVVNPLDPTNYVADLASARIALSPSGSWPADLRASQAWVIRIIAGWPSADELRAAAPLLFHAVGLLVAHYATVGRDLASIETVTEVPFGFEEAIEPYCMVSVP